MVGFISYTHLTTRGLFCANPRFSREIWTFTPHHASLNRIDTQLTNLTTGLCITLAILKPSRDCHLYTKKETNRGLFEQSNMTALLLPP